MQHRTWGVLLCPGLPVMETQRPGWDQSSGTAGWAPFLPRKEIGEIPRLPLHSHQSISLYPFCSLHSCLHCVCRSRRVYKVHRDICYKESCESTSSQRTSSRYSPQQHAACASLPVILDRSVWLVGDTQAGDTQVGVHWYRGTDITKAWMPCACL